MEEKIKVIKKRKTKKDSTNLVLLVESISQNEILEYDESYIVNAIMKDLNLSKQDAENIAKQVTDKIKKIELKNISTSLIRSFVNVVLYENGFEKELKSKNEIVLGKDDIESLIENANNENGNTTHNPESINLSIAERVLKQYALNSVFPKEISEAHLKGNITLHDLGMINRFYCSGHSPEYIKLNGIKNIPNITSNSSPANSAWVLTRHLVSFTQFLTGIYAGAIGYEGVNFFYSPYIVGWDYKKVKQLAQTLIYDLSQLAGAKGGQVAFTDFNLYIDIPDHYKNTYAVGKSGKFMVGDKNNPIYCKSREDADNVSKELNINVLKYKDFENESKLFLKALLEVAENGDANGLPFAFPKLNLHINKNSFSSDESIELLKLACVSSSKKGCPYFIFDRNAFSVSQCCRLEIKFDEKDKLLTNTPEHLRFVGGQNVTINLPNIPLSTKNEDEFYKELEYRMELAAKAHITKQEYIKKLTDAQNSSLKYYKKSSDGTPYIDFSKISYLIGVVGLNECVYNLIGKELHEDITAFEKGMEIIIFMNEFKNKLAKKYNIKIALEESPSESTASRLAMLDKKHYKESAFVKENESGVYYTNSVHYSADSEVDYIDRIINQSKYHPFVDAGSMIHTWGGENEPNPEAIYNLIKFIWEKTKTSQWVLSPEYTECIDCKKTFNGLHSNCPECNGDNLLQMTRITGYYVPIKNWNKGKLAELKDRKREGVF